jgi:two-component system, NtrC family, nitrogen regulation response regulator NtrX
MKPRILVIDDEPAIRDSLRMIIEYEDYEFIGASAGPEGIALAEREAPDLILLDIKMPGMDGFEALERIKAVSDAPVVMISGHGSGATGADAVRRGAFDFIDKPPDTDRLLVIIRNALERSRMTDEVKVLRRAVEAKHEIVGDSFQVRQLMEAVRRAAPTNATVLIQGESGVGKELIARAIHRNSLRSRERFVQVNCAAIPEELIESELFGHEKGSFTGATEKQIGKFEQADRGTIFLDEVGDMSFKTQAKVLRVLEEGEVERVGSSRTIRVDVRVIAATNKDLEKEIEKGNFREDLFFRLSVIPLHVPPLRDRIEDIPALVQHFLDTLARENNFRRRRIMPRAMEALQRHRWKGNIRELRNTIERSLIMTAGEAIDLADLPEAVRVDPRPAPPDNGGDASVSAGTLREFKESAERMFLVQKLRENGWNISRTAEVIGTPRSNLYKKLEFYKISQDVDG